MPIPSELQRIQRAIENKNHRELEWCLRYAQMRQSVSTARPADVRYWAAVERQLQDILTPPPPPPVWPTRKKKPSSRGLGLSPLPGESSEPETKPGTGTEAGTDHDGGDADPA